MEQIETQASDLRYLAQVPVPLSDVVTGSGPGSVTGSVPQSHSHTHPQSSPAGSAHVGDNSAPALSTTPLNQPPRMSVDDEAGNNNNNNNNNSDGNPNKRKSVDDPNSASAKQTRSKRNRYISIACNECKRRKIKCNGETPCQRCGNLNLACLYAANCCSTNFRDSDEFKQVTAQIGHMNEEILWLKQTVKNLQAESSKLATTQDPPLSGVSPSPSFQSTTAQRPEPSYIRYGSFRGPTSTAYTLDVANNTISRMGYTGIADVEEQPGQSTSNDTSASSRDGPILSDPLFDYDKDEMVRLCRIHYDEVGTLYPVVDFHAVMDHARQIAPFIESMKGQRPHKLLNDDKTMYLKIIMCSGLVLEGHGQSDKATRLYESMENVINRKFMSDTSNVASLPLIALVAGYRFLSNDEILAWRVMGHVSRLCLELGIHRHSELMKVENEQQKRECLISFWAAFVLDRVWAFGTGLPYVIQDEEIDPNLPIPDDSPFLASMVAFARLCSKVWKQVTHFEPLLARELRQEELERLDQEILEWFEGLPEEAKIRDWTDQRQQITSDSATKLQRLRAWTYLRLHQIRIWLYTPVLHSATSIMSHPQQAQRVVDLARNTIQYLHYLNSTTNMYNKMQVFYHGFLASAISVVFLASVHAPVRFSAVCREEFYLALDLVKDLSAKSWVSRRLWRTIRSLKEVAPRFGLNPDDDAHSSAALGMIGLARGHSAGNSAGRSRFQRPSVRPGNPSQQDMQAEKEGSRLQTEMSRMFEGYVGLNGVQAIGGDADNLHSGSDLQSPGSTSNIYGTSPSGTVFPQLREMF